MCSSVYKLKFERESFNYLHVELSLVSLADRMPLFCALLVQLGRPLVRLRHTLAVTVDIPKIHHRTLRVEL